MDQATISFLSSGNLTDRPDRRLRELCARWPAPGVPRIEHVTIDAMLAAADRNADGLALPGVLFGVLGANVSPSRVDQLADSLARLHMPGVLLVDRPQDWHVLHRHGLIFEGYDADPERLASMLYALRERQGEVRLLAHEVGLSNRCQGGMRDQMDRMHEELHLAAAVQRDLTSSPLPRLPGLDIAVLFRPVNFVSGDVYHVRDLGEGRAAFFVADAVGHGVPAALLTMVLTSSLHSAEAASGGPRPADVLHRLNERLCGNCLGTGRFATAVYGTVDSRSRTIRIAGAGHPLPIVMSSQGSREIETSGPLLGVFDDASFDEVEVQLGDDDTLMLYTDGLDAAFPLAATGAKGALLRRDRWVAELARTLDSTGTARLPRLLTELQHRLDLQAGSMHDGDDVTAVCITAVNQAA